MINNLREQLRASFVQMTKKPILYKGDAHQVFRLICTTVTEVLSVERCGIWIFSPNNDSIICQMLYNRLTKSFTMGAVLRSSEYPAYFQALEAQRMIVAHDAQIDERTKEFLSNYLLPLNILSMLDAPIRKEGKLFGVVCVETVGKKRFWEQEEEEFVASIADVITLTLDLEQRKKTEQALRESENLFHTITDTAQEAIFCTDITGNVYFWNKAAVTLFGYSVDEACGQTIASLIFPPLIFQQEKWFACMRTLELNTNETYELIARTKDKKEVSLELSIAFFIREEQPNMTFIARDISYRKQLQKENAEAKEQIELFRRIDSLGMLAGGIAHDFNNLFGAILSRLELLSIAYPSDNNIQSIEMSLIRAVELCQQLLDYADSSVFFRGPIHVNQIIQDTVLVFQAKLHKNIEIISQLEPTIPLILGDASQIQRVITNLLSNSLDAVRSKGGQIKIETSIQYYKTQDLEKAIYSGAEEGLFVCISVEDTGIGIEEEEQKLLFEPFISKKWNGKGLGLPTVLRVIRSCRGAVFLESALQEGTKFTILIPHKEISNREETVRSSIESHKMTGKILLIDDDDILLESTSLLLEYHGFSVCSFSSGKTALQDLKDNHYDCVLLDLTMPDLDGGDIFLHIREFSNIPIILTSGYAAENCFSKHSSLLTAPFIQKPYKTKDLITLIQQVLSSNDLK